MKQVVIGIGKDGNPYVVSAPRTVSVVFRQEKRRTVRKAWRTWVYRFKSALRG